MAAAVRTASLFFLGIYPIVEIFCLFLHFAKRGDLAIRKRSMGDVSVASVAGWIAYCNLIFSVANKGLNCGAYYVLTLLLPPMVAGLQLVRSIKLRGKLERSNILLKEERVRTSSQSISKRRYSRSSSERCVDISTSEERGRKGGRADEIKAVDLAVPSTTSQAGSAPVVGVNNIERNKIETRAIVRWVRNGLLVAPTALLLAAIFLDPSPELVKQIGLSKFADCNPEPVYVLYASPALGLVYTFLTLITTIALMGNNDDGLGMRTEISRNSTILACGYIVILVVRLCGKRELYPALEVVQQLLLSLSMKFPPCLYPKMRLASKALHIGIPGYARPLPPIGNRSSSLRRASQKDIKSDGDRRREVTLSLDAGLCILLSTQEGINSFGEHCVREFSYENIRFWCVINQFHAEVDAMCIEEGEKSELEEDEDFITEKLSEEEITAYAKAIFDTYIIGEGELAINLPSTMLDEVRAALGKGVRRDLFDSAQREIFTLMARDSYPRYLASKRQYLSGMAKKKSRKRLSLFR